MQRDGCKSHGLSKISIPASSMWVRHNASGTGRSLISTHAPRSGCNVMWTLMTTEPPYFNSRTQHWVRHTKERDCKMRRKFQLTRPAQGATPNLHLWHVRLVVISTHAPCTGCDFFPVGEMCSTDKFQFPHPVWDATYQAKSKRFQFTHPVWDAT